MIIPHHARSEVRKLASAALVAALFGLLITAIACAQTPDVKPNGNAIPFLPNDVSTVMPLPPANPAGRNPMLFLPALSNTASSGSQGVAPADNLGADLQAAKAQPQTLRLLVDTDPGVDDAVALTWLVSQREQPLQILGVVSVAGNTTVANATNNALLVLKQLGHQDVPVVMGAASPLVQPLTKTSYFVHGPDGLWFLGWQNPQDLSSVRSDAPAFYCATIAANPGLRLLALGPLTNIALAVQQCPDTMKTVGELVILGGAKFGGNKTVVAEFNFWQDPEAANIVLNAGLPITLVLLDAFVQPSIVQKDLDKLFAKGTPAVQFLAPAIQQYANVQFANTGRAGIPDAVAAVMALRQSEGTRAPALVKMVLEQSLARGQSIVGLTVGERATMIATDEQLSALAEQAFAYPPDPNFDFQQELGAILMSEPDNAQAVTSASATLLTKTVFPNLTVK